MGFERFPRAETTEAAEQVVANPCMDAPATAPADVSDVRGTKPQRRAVMRTPGVSSQSRVFEEPGNVGQPAKYTGARFAYAKADAKRAPETSRIKAAVYHSDIRRSASCRGWQPSYDGHDAYVRAFP